MRGFGIKDPTKRKKTIKFLIVLLIIGVSVGVISSIFQGFLGQSDPLKVCINDRNTTYKISATLELHVDGNKADIPANIGFDNVEEDVLKVGSVCQRTLYTITGDGTIYAEWEEEWPFEIGHFLWIWDFPLKDMDLSKSQIIVNGQESEMFINEPLVNGYHYKAVFISKEHEESKDTDFLPPDL